jgi:hypothetical protein
MGMRNSDVERVQLLRREEDESDVNPQEDLDDIFHHDSHDFDVIKSSLYGKEQQRESSSLFSDATRKKKRRTQLPFKTACCMSPSCCVHTVLAR